MSVKWTTCHIHRTWHHPIIIYSDHCKNHSNNKKSEKFKEINDAILAYFESKPRSFYKAGIEKLEKRCETVIASNGNYIND
jgi:hypothetical protein